jgi:uncharacterized phage-associated protein
MHEGTHAASPPYDARAVANLLLEYGREQGAPLSNLTLQKVLYFAHGLFLTRQGGPLVQGYFEAWEHGPVHPLIYHTFKDFGGRPIEGFAEGIDLANRKKVPIPPLTSEDVRHFIREISRTYGRMAPEQLVGWSHRKDAPWHAVVGAGLNRKSHFGLRIENSLIKERFHLHRLALAQPYLDGGVREELPPSCD